MRTRAPRRADPRYLRDEHDHEPDNLRAISRRWSAIAGRTAKDTSLFRAE